MNYLLIVSLALLLDYYGYKNYYFIVSLPLSLAKQNFED